MAVHADAVAETVGKVLVAGLVAGVDDDLACGGVDSLAGGAGAGGREGGGLGAVDGVKAAQHGVGGLAVDEGAGDVGLVAFRQCSRRRSGPWRHRG